MEDLSDSLAQVWNRAHLKALKLAALVAVGCNPHAPCITGPVADWAISVVTRDAIEMLSKFTSGEIGRGHSYQQTQVIELMQHYLALPVSTRRNYKAPESVWKVQLVPLSYLTTRVRTVKVFQQPNKTPRQVIEQILKEMVELEIITQVPLDQALLNYQTKMPLYAPGVNWSPGTAGKA